LRIGVAIVIDLDTDSDTDGDADEISFRVGLESFDYTQRTP